MFFVNSGFAARAVAVAEAEAGIVSRGAGGRLTDASDTSDKDLTAEGLVSILKEREATDESEEESKAAEPDDEEDVSETSATSLPEGHDDAM